MATFFLDSSALVKRYVAETGSRWVADLLAPPAGNVIHISIVSGAEVIAALVRRQRGGSLAAEEASGAIAEFGDDWAGLYELVGADRVLLDRAMLLAQRHSLHGYDAIQLASALEVAALAQQFRPPFVFVSADEQVINHAHRAWL